MQEVERLHGVEGRREKEEGEGIRRGGGVGHWGKILPNNRSKAPRLHTVRHSSQNTMRILLKNVDFVYVQKYGILLCTFLTICITQSILVIFLQCSSAKLQFTSGCEELLQCGII